ncbi:MAG: hypothetical protein C0447_12055 [Methylobacterium sp.]|nr:hypothetical protein [Methylobacterium sp.]
MDRWRRALAPGAARAGRDTPRHPALARRCRCRPAPARRRPPLRHPRGGRPRRRPAPAGLSGAGDRTVSDSILAVRAAIQARLESDPGLTALIGPARIHDEAPRGAGGSYIVHGEVEARDWSTGSDSGCEQEFGLTVWAGESGSSRLALEAAARIVALLDGAGLTLSGHRLVNLRWRSNRLARDPATGLASVAIRFRAVTEAL